MGHPRAVQDLPLVGKVLLLVFIVPLYLGLGLGDRDLWAPDEPRYALVAREMMESGQWSLPTRNGKIYAHKPPLLFWSIAGVSHLLGTDPSSGFVARLPSALCGLGTLGLTLAIGCLVFEPAVAVLGTAILATSHLFCWEAHHAQIDSMLTFFIVLAIYFMLLNETRPDPRYAWGFFLACSLATLAKGPVGLVIPIATAYLYRRYRGSTSRLFLPSGWIVMLAPLLAWLAAATWQGGWPYLEELIGRHVVKRFVDSWHHHKPPWYFLHSTPTTFLPWGMLLPGALLTAWREGRAGRLPPGVVLTLFWAGFMLVMFSIPKGKRGLYMLPAFPALSLLVAWSLSGPPEEEAPAESMLKTFGFAVLPFICLGIVILIKSYLEKREAEVAGSVEAIRLVLIGAALILLANGYPWNRRRQTQAVLVAFLPIHLCIYGLFLPSLNGHKSARDLSRLAVMHQREGVGIVYYGDLLESYVLFTGQNLVEANDPATLMRKMEGGRSRLVLLQEERLGEISGSEMFTVKILHSTRVGGKNMVLARVRVSSR